MVRMTNKSCAFTDSPACPLQFVMMMVSTPRRFMTRTGSVTLLGE